MSFLPIYIFGALSNALVSSINSRKQRALQEKLSREGQAVQCENLELQLEHTRLLHQEGYKQQIANQLRAFALTSSWPLDVEPSYIAKMLNGNGHVPLFLVVAPAQQAGIQRELYSLWEDLHNFFLAAFPLDSQTPVVHGGYRPNYPVSRSQDVMKIFAGIKNIPTLYLAPYSTERDNVLGVTVAFWGLGGAKQPAILNFELDVRKMYIDEIRQEAYMYRKKCDAGSLDWDERSPLATNWTLFEKERGLLERQNDFQYLDLVLNFYRTVSPSRKTYISMSDQILPVIKLFTAAIVDTYFVLEYGTNPKFPALSRQILEGAKMPELLSRGIASPSIDFGAMEGLDFVNRLGESYTRIIATYADVDVCKRSAEMFGELSIGNRKLFADIVEARVGRVSMNNTEFDEQVGLRNLGEQKPIDPAGGGSEADIWLRNAIICFKREDLNGCLVWAKKAARAGNQQAVLLVNKIQKVLR